jgi:hypothetical protein
MKLRKLCLGVGLFCSYSYFYQAGGWNQNSRFDLYEFEAVDGKYYTVVARTTEDKRMRDDPFEPILYDRGNPDRAIVLDQLDGPPRVDGQGRIQGASVARAALALVVPSAAVVCALTALVLLVIR